MVQKMGNVKLKTINFTLIGDKKSHILDSPLWGKSPLLPTSFYIVLQKIKMLDGRNCSFLKQIQLLYVITSNSVA